MVGSSAGGSLELSVVVPVYGCEPCLRALHDRLRSALEPLVSSFEIVFVDDRSPDRAWDTLAALAAADPDVRALRLSRNFGQHAAITAGLTESRGRWVVVMDCDLEEPPEVIPRLYAKAQEGFEIVHTRRVGRSHSLVRRMAGRLYFRLRNLLLETDTAPHHGTLSILSRRVVDAFVSIRDRDREYLAMLDWLGFTHATVEFEHGRRHAGTTAYTFRKLVRVAVDGVFFQTTVLLRWIVLLGFLVALAGAGLATYYVVVYFTSEPPSGYTSLAVLLTLLTGFVIVSLGVVGLYVGKVFEQVKARPLYVIEAEAGADRPAPALVAEDDPEAVEINASQ